MPDKRAGVVAALLLALLTSTTGVAPPAFSGATPARALPAVGSGVPTPRATGAPGGLYERYLRDHLGHLGRILGQRLMAGQDLLAPGVPATPPLPPTPEVPPAPAPGGAPSPLVTQNGVCNDARPPRSSGETALLWVVDFGLQRQVQRAFTLAAVSDHAYVWVESAAYDPSPGVGDPRPVTSRGQAAAAAARFERIYETDRQYFGEPPRCDVLPFRQPPRMPELWGRPWYDADDDPHVNIVNFSADAAAGLFVGGYYSSADEYPRTVNSASNEGEFLYMDTQTLEPATNEYDQILAHELYHMIQFGSDANEEVWLNEGMADIAIEVNGFSLDPELEEYASHPDDALTHWEGELKDYGNAYSFLSYLLTHYGPPDDPATPFRENYALALAVTRTESDGLQGLDEVLASNPYRGRLPSYYRGRTSDDVYLDRAVANVVNDPTLLSGQYGYLTPALSSFRVRPTATATYPAAGQGTIRPYGEQYLAFDSAGDGRLQLRSDSRVPILPNAQGMPSPTHEVWFDRGDAMRTFVVREADLTDARSPRLRFGYWYDLDEDFDYVYLQVSRDGGRSWTNLDCVCGSRRSDPHHKNEGYGISGASTSGSPLEQGPAWQRAEQDLSAYAGQRVLVRFLYVTDQAVTRPGFALDDVELSDGPRTLWPLENFEHGPGAFTMGGAEGRTARLIEPQAPNRLVLQVVDLGRRVEVARLPGAPEGAGTPEGGQFLAATAPLAATRSITIATSLTRDTTDPFHVAWSADATPPASPRPPSLRVPESPVRAPFTLAWTPGALLGPHQPAGYEVQETDVLVEHVSDDAERGLGDWTSSTEGTGGIPWTVRGDKRHSGRQAFWAGALDGATDASSLLTFARPLSLPASARTTLSFWDFHRNDPGTTVAVEVSEDGRRWIPVHHRTSPSSAPPEGATAVATGALEPSVVDLSAWAGRTVRLRLRLSVAGRSRPGTHRFGWWVDDVAVATQRWRDVADTDTTSVEIGPRPPGIRWFRVAALYGPNLRGPWSNVVQVTIR